MSRISVSINSYAKEAPGENKSYSVSFDGEFSKVRDEVDKIYEKFKTNVIQGEGTVSGGSGASGTKGAGGSGN